MEWKKKVSNSDFFEEARSLAAEFFTPFRRKVNFLKAKEVSIIPLIPQLTFIQNKKSWGGVFRFGMVQISEEDFALIAEHMIGVTD